MSEKKIYEAGFGSDAVKHPQRIVFITKKTSAKVTGDVGRRLLHHQNRRSILFIVLGEK